MDCPVGRYSSENAALSTCTACAPGKANPNTASTTYSACVDCTVGKYAELEATETCLHCPDGKANPSTTAATSVSDCSVTCPAGETNNAESTACESCPLGRYNPSPSSPCLACGQGKYMDFTGAVAETQCKVCVER